MATESVTDVVSRVARTTEKVGALLLELRDESDASVRNARLREAGRHLGELSAECLARAAEADSARAAAIDGVIIHARTRP